MDKKIDASIALITHKSENSIFECLKSILAQTIRKIEIIIIEDPPFDRTRSIVDSFKDSRIIYLRNSERLGISGSRNICLKMAKAKYVFFTDDDCLVEKNWVEEGLKTLQTSDCVAVEGKTVYVSEEYRPTFSDRVIDNREGGQFMTCNIGYKMSILKSVGGFDESFSRLADRDLALRLLKIGKISFNPYMLVYHQKRDWTPKQFVKANEAVRNRVLLFKKHKDKSSMIMWKLFHPSRIVTLLFPPLVFASLFRNRYRTSADFALFPFIYIGLLYERLSLWNMCAKEGILLI